jgi:hypothetical protein
MTISTEKDQVRLLISDVGGQGGTSFLFSDDEILTFLALRPDVRMAAALALRTIAGNEAQTQKAMKFFDLSTNGPAVAKSLMDQASALEQQADDDSDFEIADMGADFFGRRYLRGFD